MHSATVCDDVQSVIASSIKPRFATRSLFSRIVSGISGRPMIPHRMVKCSFETVQIKTSPSLVEKLFHGTTRGCRLPSRTGIFPS